MIAIKAPRVHYIPHKTMRLFDEPMMYGNKSDWKGDSTKNGPAIGAIGAIGSISAGLSASGLLGGVLIAGGVLGGIGALTGNKTLMAIGSVSALAGGFISADTGAFFNPFGEGAGQSILSKGMSDTFGSVFDKLKSTFGMPTSSAASNLNPAGSLADTLSQSASSPLADVAASSAQNIGGGISSALTETMGAGAKAAASGAASTAASGASQGLIGQLMNSGGGALLAGSASGLAGGLMQQGVNDAQVDNYEANADLTRARTQSELMSQQLQEQRQKNLQYQNTGNLPTVNSGAQVTGRNPGAASGRVPVTMPDGSVQLVTLEQYAAMKNGGTA